MRRMFIILFLLMCVFAGRAEAFLDSSNCAIFWKAYVLPGAPKATAPKAITPKPVVSAPAEQQARAVQSKDISTQDDGLSQAAALASGGSSFEKPLKDAVAAKENASQKTPGDKKAVPEVATVPPGVLPDTGGLYDGSGFEAPLKVEEGRSRAEEYGAQNATLRQVRPSAPVAAQAPPPPPPPPGSPRVLVGLTILPPDGHYLYGPESTQGIPTSIDVSFVELDAFPAKRLRSDDINALVDKKGRALTVRMPQTVRKKDSVFSSMVVTGTTPDNPDIYPGPATFWVEVPSIRSKRGGAVLSVSMSGLLCTTGSCMPASGSVNITLTAAELSAFPKASEQGWWKAFNAGESVLIPPPDDALAKNFFPSDEPALSVTLQENKENPAVLPKHVELFASLDPAFFNPDLEVQDVWQALFFGLLAGLLLNLMPCVLPVVSLKFSALMAVSSMTDKWAQAKAFRVHCLIFAAGILVWFIVLAFLIGVAGWAWGEMFQQPLVIVALGLVLFILGLSLFGVFPLPIFDLKVTNDSHPHWQAFASGLLATLLATPCSGPLLGGVLAWAIRQHLPVLVLTVASVGVGMALPYFVLAFWPRLVHLLPRPGKWTLRLEQLLGFFLMGTVCYLATLLPVEWIPAFLFNLLAMALACWIWGQIGHLGASPLRRAISRFSAVAVVLLAVWWGSLTIANDGGDWEAFDPQAFSEVLGKQAMLLEFTADWCPSCKALEYTTLNKQRMAELRRKYNVRTIRVDMTRDDLAAKELLKSLGSTSIPVIALFPTGEHSRKPVVLRDIVTPTQLDEAAAQTYNENDFLRFRQNLSTRTACFIPVATLIDSW